MINKTPYFGTKLEYEPWSSQATKNWIRAVRTEDEPYRKLFLEPAFDEFRSPLLDKVLDLGCGEGIDTRRFARDGAQVTGVDISSGFIQVARELAEEEGLKIKFIQSSFTDLQVLENNSFDQVISTMALMDGPNIEAACQEAYRVLKPGGDFFFIIKHPFTNRPNKKREEGNLVQSESYFQNKPYMQAIEFQDSDEAYEVKALSYQRTLSDYLNPLAQAGFIIQKVGEPQPSGSIASIYPRMKIWQKEPFYLEVHCKKPVALQLEA